MLGILVEELGKLRMDPGLEKDQWLIYRILIGHPRYVFWTI